MLSRRVLFFLLIISSFVSIYIFAIGKYLTNAFYYYIDRDDRKKIEVDLENVGVANINLLSRDKSSIHAESINNDPMLNISLEEAITLANISFKLKTVIKDHAQVFYISEGETGFQETKSLRIETSPGLQEVLIKFPIFDSPTKVVAIRLDPTEENKSFEISDIILNK